MSEGGARKGQYVGFRDDAMRAIERMKSVHRLDSIDNHNILVMEIRLSAEAFTAMATEKIYDQCWVPRLHYVSYTNSMDEWGVWYYHGQPFPLNARGVYVFPPQAIQ